MLVSIKYSLLGYQTYVSCNLLGQHVIISLPCCSREIVRVPGSDTAEARVAVTTASSSADLQTLCCDRTAERLQRTRGSVQICQHVTAGLDFLWPSATLAWCVGGITLSNFLLVLLVHVHHRLSGKMECKSGSEKREQPDLHHGVVENRGLIHTSRSISILELTTHSAVTGCDGDTSSKHTAGLHNNGRSDPSQGTVDKRWRTTATEFVCVGVNKCVLGQHTDMRNLDVVEQEETVVHGVVTKFRTNISDVNVFKRLMCLQITDLNAERRWSVGLAINDELSHDDSMVGCPAQGSDPPFTGGQVWRVDGEGLVVLVPRCCCFKSTNI